MRKIIDWTFGSIFRTFGRVIAFILIGLLISLILSKNDVKITDLFGIYTIKAKSVSITSQSYSIRHISMNNYDYLWTSYVSNGTQTQINTNTYATRGFRTKFYSSSKFDKDQSYQARVRLNSTPKGTYEAAYPYTEFSCYGSISNSNYSAETSLIKSCQLVSVVIESGNNFTDYYINFTPNSNIETVQFVILWELNQPMERINIDSSSTIKYDTSTQDAINSQTDSLINNQNSNTTSIINNQDSNTSDIINNQNSNTQDIIDNQNANNQAQIESQKICEHYDKSKIKVSGYYLNTQGNASTSNNYGVSEYIKIINAEIKELTHLDTTSQSSMCFYNVNHTLISCIRNNNIGSSINIPSNAYYVMFSINKNEDKPQFQVCRNGNQGISDGLNSLNDSLNDDDTSQAQSEASNFFSSFSTNTHGLTGIITAPLNAIQGLTSKTCSPLVLPLPYVNQNLTLPCMRQIYVDNFGSFMNIYDVITLGIISYWIMVRIFALVKDFKNPDHDEIEVVDL